MSTLNYTNPGSGSPLATDTRTGDSAHMQVYRLAGDTAGTLMPGDGTRGLYVNAALRGDGVGVHAEVSPLGVLLAAPPVRLFGDPVNGSSLDTRLWTKTETSGGTVTVASGVMELSTNTTANAGAKVAGLACRWIPGTANAFGASVRFGDSGTANNKKWIGVGDANDGAFWLLDGTTWKIVTRKGTSDTTVISFSGATPARDTSVHRYEIIWTESVVYFLQDGALVHTVTSTTARWANTPHLAPYIETVNAGGSTTDIAIETWGVSVDRYGPKAAAADAGNINSNATTTLRTGPGTLRRITINKAGASSNIATIYDNTAASGTVLGVIDTTVARTLEYDIPFRTGLTIVTATGTAADLTVVFD